MMPGDDSDGISRSWHQGRIDAGAAAIPDAEVIWELLLFNWNVCWNFALSTDVSRRLAARCGSRRTRLRQFVSYWCVDNRAPP